MPPIGGPGLKTRVTAYIERTQSRRKRHGQDLPVCRSQHLIKNGSAYGVPKGKCKDCLRQTSFKPPRGEPLWMKETAVPLYTLGLSKNAIAKQLGVSTPSILNWIRAHAAKHAPCPQPEPGESVVVMELDELWHFLQKKEQAVDLVGF